MKNIIIAGVLLFAVACADKQDEDYAVREQAALDIWMAANHPAVGRTTQGTYIEWLRKSDATVARATTGDWVFVDYVVRDLEGRVIGQRNPAIAEVEGTFTPVTHYSPHFAKLDSTLWYFTQGEYEALKLMKPTDSVRLYLPASRAYNQASIEFTNGYGGWWYGGGNPGATFIGKPVTIDLALREVVGTDPEAYELSQVEAARGTMTAVSDTLSGLYFEVVDNTGAGEVIPEDSTVYVTYSLRFLDNQLVMTNNVIVAYAEWQKFGDLYDNYDTYVASGISPISGTALDRAVEHGLVRYNMAVRLMFVSDYGYGSNGLSASGGSSSERPNPVVYPYTPLILEVRTMPADYEPET